ncbi:hypothetical protein E1B28_005173 [Marasmius oreades]|uniref:Uncharacterized protein n=1 Tax=Marasmius oreades TaxID=181124 RepID=A0A9P7V079_9AGAR|nr:uncharacterized protein E1B28_005173 [Marasmius oreades]KAG7097861.1 hypothetical protein E1B28_005173 [Marasmius oreades]
MGFYSDFMLVPTGPKTTTATSSLVSVDDLNQYNLNDNVNNTYQTPIRNDLVPASTAMERSTTSPRQEKSLLLLHFL